MQVIIVNFRKKEVKTLVRYHFDGPLLYKRNGIERSCSLPWRGFILDYIV